MLHEEGLGEEVEEGKAKAKGVEGRHAAKPPLWSGDPLPFSQGPGPHEVMGNPGFWAFSAWNQPGGPSSPDGEPTRPLGYGC